MRAAGRCECLLIEDIGGMLGPLCEGVAVVGLVARVGCAAIVLSPDRLGAMNHTVLAARTLEAAWI